MARQRHGFSLAMFVCIVGICSPPAQAAAKAGTGPVLASRVAADVIALTNILNSNFTEMGVKVFARPLS